MITSTLASCLLFKPERPKTTLGPLNSMQSNPGKPAISCGVEITNLLITS